MDHVRGSSLAWPESLEALRPFIVTWWSGRTVEDMPPSVKKVHDEAKLGGKHINIALVVLDENGKVLRGGVPFVQPPYFQFDPDAQGRDFKRQLDDLLKDLKLPATDAKAKPTLHLPEVKDGVRIYLTFESNRLNHYRTPVVEAVPMSEVLRKSLAYPTETRQLKAKDLRTWLEQMYPPAIMDGKGGFEKIDGTFKITQAGRDKQFRYAILEGDAEFVLDNVDRTSYRGSLSVVLKYQPDGTLKTIRGILEAKVPKGPEMIAMKATIESSGE